MKEKFPFVQSFSWGQFLFGLGLAILPVGIFYRSVFLAEPFDYLGFDLPFWVAYLIILALWMVSFGIIKSSLKSVNAGSASMI